MNDYAMPNIVFRPEDITCLRTGAPVAEAFKAVSEIWDNQSGEGKIEELPTKIDKDQDWENQDPENQDLENLVF